MPVGSYRPITARSVESLSSALSIGSASVCIERASDTVDQLVALAESFTPVLGDE